MDTRGPSWNDDEGMKTYIALFRGINVGGRNMLPMKELKPMLERNGCLDVQTYIQSGNVVFRSAMSDVARLSKLRSVLRPKMKVHAPF